MIPAALIATLDTIRTDFVEALRRLEESPGFASLRHGSAPLRAAFEEARLVAAGPGLRRPCDGRIVCAIVGSSTAGKTTILAELLPELAERGWLEAGPTAQALRIGR